MGAAQASDTVFSILAKAHERGDKSVAGGTGGTFANVKQSYEERTDICSAPLGAGWTLSSNRTKRVTY